ncbi:hypothetical protein KSX_46780 [Ktedonospora formicarum]|uniref:Uncharacterized protein n=1 Tax=Ktedonospora formicarum TaxID=2778364 RepID=A0A8J3I4D9_9CHLR|nr:hypothetical protein KSX_46780 [Ktedonospora formicarum]
MPSQSFASNAIAETAYMKKEGLTIMSESVINVKLPFEIIIDL